MLERSVLIAQELLASSPDFAELNGRLMRALLQNLGTTNPTLAGLGLGADKGFAFFVTGDRTITMVLPVADRHKFVAAGHGSEGAQSDDVAGFTCKTLGNRYVCAQRREQLAMLGRDGLASIRRTLAARGDIELAAHDMDLPVRSITAAAELERGALTGPVAGLAPTRLARELAEGRWSAALFGRGSHFDLKRAMSFTQTFAGAENIMPLLPLLNEVGVGLRGDGDAVHAIAGVRTIWSNPDEVVQKVLAISSDDLFSGKAPAIAHAIASSAPTSFFAQDIKAGYSGYFGLIMSLGMLSPLLPMPSEAAQHTASMPAKVHLRASTDARSAGNFPLVAARAALKTTIFSRRTPTPAPEPPTTLVIEGELGNSELCPSCRSAHPRR
jgi:hypothetical protein